jgi:hypothetical protein
MTDSDSPPSKFLFTVLQKLPGKWFNVSEIMRRRFLPARFLLHRDPTIDTCLPSIFNNEVLMFRPIPEEIMYIREFKGAPLSVLMVMAVADCTLTLPQLVDMTGYDAGEVLSALEHLYESRFIEKDVIHNGWVLSSMYALILFDEARSLRRN